MSWRSSRRTHDDHVKIGVLVGSLLGALVAAVVLRARNRTYRRIEEREGGWVGSATMASTATGEQPTPVARPAPDDPTIGRLVADASRDISTLVSKEIELAKSELKVSVQAGGIGIGLFAGAVFIALLGVIMLSFAFAYFIHWAGLGLHWSFLIVFGLYLLLAGAARLPRLEQGQAGRPPERAIEQGREIPKALKGQFCS